MNLYCNGSVHGIPCGSKLEPGKAIIKTFAGKECSTGTATLVNCMKCVRCGKSYHKGDK